MFQFDFFIVRKDFYMKSCEIFLSAEMKAMKKFMFAKITVDESFMLLEKVKIERLKSDIIKVPDYIYLQSVLKLSSSIYL